MGSQDDPNAGITRHTFFDGMKPEHFAILSEGAKEMLFKAGEVLFREGEEAFSL